MKKPFKSKRTARTHSANKPRLAVSANKKLGQHFLTDPHMIARIVDAIDPQENGAFLEIGPGLGAITLPVLAACKQLTAIEFDERVLAPLHEKAAAIGKLDLIHGDVLALDLANLLADKPNWVVFGNLPYNISTPILFKLLPLTTISRMTFMLQKEVILRMAAHENTADYGRLAVMLAPYFDVVPLFDVPPESFSPPPKVMSAMVNLYRLPTPRFEIVDHALFARVVKQSFAMRRKTLQNNLKLWLSSADFAKLDIDPQQRAETLPAKDFARITQYLTERGNHA